MRIRFICGKGGVGKSAVAAALTQAYAHSGGALCVAIDQPDSLTRFLDSPSLPEEPVRIRNGLWAVHLDRQRCLDDFVLRYFKIRFVSRWILDHPLYPYITAVAPGIWEYLILDRIRNLAEPNMPWKTIIVDTPATGHGVHLLNIATPLAAALKLGPMRFRILRTEQMLQDPARTQIILVTIPAELPLSEMTQLTDLIRDHLNMSIHSIIINRHEMFSIPPNLKSILKTIESDAEAAGDFLVGFRSRHADCDLNSALSAARFLDRKHLAEKRHIQKLSSLYRERKIVLPDFADSSPLLVSTAIQPFFNPEYLDG
ncbi:ArsA family ATPase [bacterium]|nr:ArsA family ATPase [candidate division CSSED10-310 bacterium]